MNDEAWVFATPEKEKPFRKRSKFSPMPAWLFSEAGVRFASAVFFGTLLAFLEGNPGKGCSLGLSLDSY